jgi:hypothetical protein
MRSERLATDTVPAVFRHLGCYTLTIGNLTTQCAWAYASEWGEP